MKRSPFIVSLIVAALTIVVRAADVTGVWSLRLLTAAGESAARATITLKQDGENVTGRCVIDQTEEELAVAGQVTGATLTWRCVGKGSFEASFKGTIDSTGRQMTGEWATNAAKGSFKGSRPPR